MNLNRSLVFLIAAIVCFLVGFLLAVDVISGSNVTAWTLAGLTAFAAAHLPYIDPADYAVSGKTMVMRLVASFAQNGVANAATSVATAGLYSVTPAGTTTTWLPTYALVNGTTAARTGGAAGSKARVASSTFNAPAANLFALAVAISTATTAGATRISLRLEYSYA